MNRKYDSKNDMQNHVVEFESMFSRLALMDANLDESLQVALLLVSVSDETSSNGTVAAIKTKQAENATWNYVSTRPIVVY